MAREFLLKYFGSDWQYIEKDWNISGEFKEDIKLFLDSKDKNWNINCYIFSSGKDSDKYQIKINLNGLQPNCYDSYSLEEAKIRLGQSIIMSISAIKYKREQGISTCTIM